MDAHVLKPLTATLAVLIVVSPVFVAPNDTTADAADESWHWVILAGYVRYGNESGLPAAGATVTAYNLDTNATLENVTDTNGGFEWDIYSGGDWHRNDTIRITASQQQGNGYTGWHGETTVTLNISKPYILRNVTLHLPPPSVPSLQVPDEGFIGEKISFHAESDDQNNLNISYGWDWDDDHTVDEWTSWSKAGTTRNVTHSWDDPGTYKVRAIAKNERERLSNWSECRTLAIANQPPDTPANPYPANGSTGISRSPSLSWNCSDPDSQSITYTLRFGPTQHPPTVSPNQTAALYQPDTLAYGTTYYWQIIARDTYGATAESPIWHFTTAVQPQYTLTVSSRPSDGGSIVRDPDLQTYPADATVTVTAQPASGYVFTHWSGDINGAQEAERSITFVTDRDRDIVAHFEEQTPGNTPPDTPVAVYPMAGAGNVSVNATLSWTCNDTDGDSLSYDVYCGISTPLPQLASNISTAACTAVLQPNETYHWQIVAWDEQGAKNESPIWEFQTGTVNESNAQPEIAISQPEDGDVLSRAISVTGTAWDPDGNDTLTAVEIQIDDGEWMTATGTEKWGYPLDPSALGAGRHTIRARAYDGTSYSAVTSVNVTLENSETPGFTLFFWTIAISVAMAVYTMRENGRR